MALGAISSLAIIAVSGSSVLIVSLVSLLLGGSLGFGMPTCMSYFADSVPVESRGRVGGAILLASGIGIFAFAIVQISNLLVLGIVLLIWRLSSLAIFLLVRSSLTVNPKSTVFSYRQVIGQQSFILYFVPWVMFSLINTIASPLTPGFGSGAIPLVQTGFMGASAVLGGFFIDSVGRKRVAMVGFILLGIGSAVLGVSFTNIYGLYFNAIIDGIAWGFLLVLFILTLWGDLSYSAASDKFYALGVAPFFVSEFLGFAFGKYINDNLISSSAIFSFAAFFLFLAVLPLFYASETLPEKRIRERELNSYLDKAKKVKEKYS